MSGERTQPRLNGVHAFGDHGEVAALYDLFDQPEFLRRKRGIGIPYRHRRGDIGLADMIGTQLLQRRIGIGGLVGGIAVHQHRRLVGHHFLDDGGE